MTKVQALEGEISALSSEELAELHDWFVAFDARQWDRQIRADAEAGKLDRLAAEALEAHRRGESREL